VSESHGSPAGSTASGSTASDTAADSGRTTSSGERTGVDGDIDERSQRLLQGGAASRSWADTAARETVRSESFGAGGGVGGGSQASSATATYSSASTASAAPSAGAATGAAGAAGAARTAQPRRARLRISHVNPMSVLRLALLFGLCMLVVLLVAVAALWFVLNSAGVFSSVTEATSTITDNSNGSTAAWFSFGRVMLVTAVLGVINVLAFTLLSTIGALLYNLCSDFVGGVEVTLSER
jgi:hypothetical protein